MTLEQRWEALRKFVDANGTELYVEQQLGSPEFEAFRKAFGAARTTQQEPEISEAERALNALKRLWGEDEETTDEDGNLQTGYSQPF